MASPLPASASPTDPVAAARVVLERVVRERCLTPGAEPWALIHGLLACGADARVGGQPGIDLLVTGNLDLARLAFPRQRDGRLVEPHPATFVKVLLELGVDPARRFEVGGRGVSLDELADRVATDARLGAGPLPFHNEAWQLEVLAAVAERDPAWRAQRDALRERALAVLAENQAYLAAHVGPDAKPYAKPFQMVDGRPQPLAIHRYFCGGLHLFQAVQRLFGSDAPPALLREYELLRARIHLEDDYWEAKSAEALGRFRGDEALRHQQLIGSQQVKLLGHALETLLRARVAGALPDSPGLTASLDDGFQRLARVVNRLEALGVFGRLDPIRAEAPQLYLDLVGDAAHALHAYVLRDAR